MVIDHLPASTRLGDEPGTGAPGFEATLTEAEWLSTATTSAAKDPSHEEGADRRNNETIDLNLTQEA